MNQGGDLKQVDLNSAVANSQAVQTLNSNLGVIKYISCSLADSRETYTVTLNPGRVYLIITSHILFGSALYLICNYDTSQYPDPKVNYLGGCKDCLSFSYKNRILTISPKTEDVMVRPTVIEIGVTG